MNDDEKLTRFKEPTGRELLLFWGSPPFLAIIISYLWVSFNHLTGRDFLNHIFVLWGILAFIICYLAIIQGPRASMEETANER